MALPAIIIDTREKDPFPLALLGAAVIRRKLDTGDYSIDGLESRVCLERKSLDDFVGTFVMHMRARRAGNQSRWGREIERMKLIPRRVIVIEGTLEHIEAGLYRAKVHKHQLFGYITRLEEHHGIDVRFIGVRPSSTKWAHGWLTEAANELTSKT